MWVGTPISVVAVLLPRVRRPDRGLGDEPPVLGLQHAGNQVCDVRRVELAWIIGLGRRLRRLALAEAGEHLAGIDLHNANVVLPKLRPPALGHRMYREFARAIRRAIGESALPRGRGDVHDISVTPADEVLR